MACKITHRVNDQQIRFANRDAAERYADIMGGGVQNWIFTTVPNVEHRQPRLSISTITAGSPRPTHSAR